MASIPLGMAIWANLWTILLLAEVPAGRIIPRTPEAIIGIAFVLSYLAITLFAYCLIRGGLSALASGSYRAGRVGLAFLYFLLSMASFGVVMSGALISSTS